MYVCVCGPPIYAMNIVRFVFVPDLCFSDHCVCLCPHIYSYKITVCVSIPTFILIRSLCVSLSPHLFLYDHRVCLCPHIYSYKPPFVSLSPHLLL